MSVQGLGPVADSRETIDPSLSFAGKKSTAVTRRRRTPFQAPGA